MLRFRYSNHPLTMRSDFSLGAGILTNGELDNVTVSDLPVFPQFSVMDWSHTRTEPGSEYEKALHEPLPTDSDGEIEGLQARCRRVLVHDENLTAYEMQESDIRNYERSRERDSRNDSRYYSLASNGTSIRTFHTTKSRQTVSSRHSAASHTTVPR
jgi:hypothetical protein